jgi:uncharacterized protein YwgA
MERSQRSAVVLDLVNRLRDAGSWCGETHIQKATYFLQRLGGGELGFEFILYKYGPYSFDLSQEITELRADDLIAWKFIALSYGPSLAPTENGQRLLECYPKARKKFKHLIDFISEQLGPKNVIQLERLATALYVMQESGRKESEFVEEINRIKPHISLEEATDSLRDVQKILAAAKQNGLCFSLTTNT